MGYSFTENEQLKTPSAAKGQGKGLEIHLRAGVWYPRRSATRREDAAQISREKEEKERTIRDPGGVMDKSLSTGDANSVVFYLLQSVSRNYGA